MNALPQCIGIILDGNRRWAAQRGLPAHEGHRRGFNNLIHLLRCVRDRGIPHLACFAFSTENWKRSTEEVSYLMDIFRTMIDDAVNEYLKENIRIRFIGERERFAPDIQRAMQDAEEKTAAHIALTVWMCLSYGGRAEIVAAARAAAQEGVDITEESLRAHFWSAEMPDPDIIIRTGRERRLSNFLLWQAAYSELFFLDVNWPDFNEGTFDTVLSEYATRERRHGR